MRAYSFKKIDAFTTGAAPGNPAARIDVERPGVLTPEAMIAAARMLKGFVNEVAFVSVLDEGTVVLDFASSERMVEFCGHATIAVVHDLATTDPRFLGKPVVAIETPKGRLEAQNRVSEDGAVYIDAPAAAFAPSAPDRTSVAAALGTTRAALDGNLPITVVNAGLDTLLVPLASRRAALDLAPDFGTLRRFCEDSRVDIVEVFSSETTDASNDYRVRVFAPRFGYLEDPATGSGNSALGAWLLDSGRWTGERLSLEQNGSPTDYNVIKLEKAGARGLRFGGAAATRIEGRIFLS